MPEAEQNQQCLCFRLTTLQHTDSCGCLKHNHLHFNSFVVWSEANTLTLHTLMSIQQGAQALHSTAQTRLVLNLM